MRKSKADQTVEGVYIILSSISKGIAFVHRGVTDCGFRKLEMGRVCEMIILWYRCCGN